MKPIGLLLTRLSGQRRRLMDGNLRRKGLTGPQIHVLGYLDRKRERGESCTQTDVRRECSNTRSSSVTSLLQGLERGGYIRRETGADARQKIVILTGEGLRLAQDCKAFLDSLDRAMTRGFSAEDEECFLRLLSRAGDNLEAFCGEEQLS